MDPRVNWMLNFFPNFLAVGIMMLLVYMMGQALRERVEEAGLDKYLPEFMQKKREKEGGDTDDGKNREDI